MRTGYQHERADAVVHPPGRDLIILRGGAIVEL